MAPETTRVAVTGGGGFMGQALVVDQARRGHAVRSLDLRHLASVPADLGGRIERLDGSILDPAVVARTLAGCTTMFHLASAHREVRQGEAYYHRVNVEGTRVVLEQARQAGVGRIVHVSSVGVYGEFTGEAYTEDSPTRPTIAYERTKLEAERLARHLAAEHGLELVVARPSWVYGAGCRRTRKIFNAIRQRRFLMVGRGRVRRDGIYIDDCVEALDRCARRPEAAGEVVLVVSGEAPAVVDWVAGIAAVEGVEPPRLRVPVAPMWVLGLGLEIAFKLIGKDAPFSRRSLKFFTNQTVFEPAKMRRLLGFTPQVSWREGLHRTAAALRSGPGTASTVGSDS